MFLRRRSVVERSTLEGEEEEESCCSCCGGEGCWRDKLRLSPALLLPFLWAVAVCRACCAVEEGCAAFPEEVLRLPLLMVEDEEEVEGVEEVCPMAERGYCWRMTEAAFARLE